MITIVFNNFLVYIESAREHSRALFVVIYIDNIDCDEKRFGKIQGVSA